MLSPGKEGALVEQVRRQAQDACMCKEWKEIKGKLMQSMCIVIHNNYSKLRMGAPELEMFAVK